ncbi:MAG: anti-sigma factor RsbA family regulatory protein [Solirubrobacteraceae bacterium]
MNEQRTTEAQTSPALIHEALLYRNDGHLGDVVSDFAVQAARAGEPVLVVLPAASENVVRSAVCDSGAELHFEDMSACGRNPACLLDLFADWIEDHDGPVRMIDEPVWPGRRHAEVVEVLRHEALLNHVLAPRQASILSAYHAHRLEPETLEGAALTHPRLVTNGTRRTSDLYADPLEVLEGTRWPLEEGREPISEFDFGGDLQSLRAAIAADPVAESLDRERRADLIFVINEAATNAVKHGDGRCTTRLWNDGDTVVSEVVTSSRLGDALVGRRRPPTDAAGGRGLWLINQLCDLVELRTGEGGTRLRMHLRYGT